MRSRRSISIWAAAALAGSCLSACSMSDDTLARVLVAPGKYEIYNCTAIATTAKSIAPRLAELKTVMARAGTTASGRFVNATTYRPEYLSLHGEMMDLRQAKQEKHCGPIPGIDAPLPPESATGPLPPPKPHPFGSH